jgi:hypothetical protein
MSRPSSITPEMIARIEAAYRPGMSAKVLRRMLGDAITLRTLQRYLAQRQAAPIAERAAALAANVPEPAPEIKIAVGDDLAAIEQLRDRYAQALADWMPRVGHDGAAVRAIDKLTRIVTGLTRSLVELRPRPEADRYAPLEGEALTELIQRARANAEPGELEHLRDRVQAQARSPTSPRSSTAYRRRSCQRSADAKLLRSNTRRPRICAPASYHRPILRGSCGAS